MSDSTVRRMLEPEGWAPPRGYANGVVAQGRVVSLAGQVGWDPVTCTFGSDDFAQQTAQALRNIVALLNEAGARREHLVRLTWFITSREEYMEARRALGASWREIVGAYYPPMSVVIVTGLIEPRAKVEIEAMAVIPA